MRSTVLANDGSLADQKVSKKSSRNGESEKQAADKKKSVKF